MPRTITSNLKSLCCDTNQIGQNMICQEQVSANRGPGSSSRQDSSILICLKTPILGKTQDKTQNMSNSPILTLFDFRSSRDVTIYLPSNVKMKKGKARVIYESERPLRVLVDT